MKKYFFVSLFLIIFCFSNILNADDFIPNVNKVEQKVLEQSDRFRY